MDICTLTSGIAASNVGMRTKGSTNKDEKNVRRITAAVFDWFYTPEPFRKESARELAVRLKCSKTYVYNILQRIPAADQFIADELIESVRRRYAIMLDVMMSSAIDGNIDSQAQLIALAGKKMSLGDSNKVAAPSIAASKVNSALNGQFEIAKPKSELVIDSTE